MFTAAVALFASLLCLATRLGYAHFNDRRLRQQHGEIAARGACSQGRVFAVQRPFLFESVTRLYFEFVPPGAEQAIQCCHMERRPPGSLPLPSVGSLVTVRFLPEYPATAAIGNLLT